ncbi:c-type cytochrome [Gimibacter soli]|uniref:Cytochrome c n=1 Tax=Gimibacter soli TaxID=3024400 RepID=A0AAF0BL12_9PROT|nr:cytochrome c [Gimibacter soli]WCL52905.1 cytochrome c [Gimibacter soli]
MKAEKKNSILKYTAALGAVSASLYLLSYYEAQTLPDMTLHPQNPDLVQRGQVLYSQYCAGCHGDNLEGQPGWQEKKALERRRAPPLDATGKAWRHSDKSLFIMTKFGVHALEGMGTLNSDMPAFEDTLKDEEIVAVLSYVESTWPKGDTDERENTSGPE